MNPATGPGAAAAILRRLSGLGQTLAVAESLTGGLLCAALVEVPGASRVFRGGIVAYATDLKHRLVGVPMQLLTARGAVDPEVAVALAAGVRRACGADWGVATTGVAGPERQDGAPVGQFHVAVCGPSEPPAVRSRHVDGDRSAIRGAAVRAALDLLDAELGGAGQG